ncbi:MAG TPA: hypothetical protein PLL30_17815, partial [Candidatus Krumholzibacteria bacterium]|nr:hypothetical protein [Candidatus Krumholzibacteria bacterium]
AGTYEPATWSRSRGALSGVTVAVHLSENGAIPEVYVNANLGFDISVAASAALSNRYPWHDNAIAWGENVASDTASAEAAGKHVITGGMLGTGWEGDTVSVNVRVYAGGSAIYDTTAVKILDAPGVLRTALWYSALGYATAAVDSGYVPALADTDDVFDLVLEADGTDRHIRYAYCDSDTAATPIRTGYLWNSATRSRRDAAYAAGSSQIILWYNMAFIPTDATILHSRLHFVCDGDALNLSAGQYLTARLDTLTHDLAWLAAPARTVDARQHKTSWTYMNSVTQTPWWPRIIDRDDMHDIGPEASTTIKSHSRWIAGFDFASNVPWYIDAIHSDQQYLDRGADRVNAGYWLNRSINNTGAAAATGFSVDMGNGGNMTQQPCKVMQWVTGVPRTKPFGIGAHKIPLTFVAHDTYTEQIQWLESWGPAGFSLAVNAAWIDGFHAKHTGHLTATRLDSLYQVGCDFINHGTEHEVPLGARTSLDSLYALTRRTWIDSVITRTTTDTTNVELADYQITLSNETPDYKLMNIKWMIDNDYRSVINSTNAAEQEPVGTQTHLYWGKHVNIYNLATIGIGNYTPADSAAAAEILGWEVDQASDDYHRPIIYWAHEKTEVSNDEMDRFALAIHGTGWCELMHFEDMVTWRLRGQTPLVPSHTAAENTWMPAPAGIDSVYARQEDWLHRIWYPPYED